MRPIEVAVAIALVLLLVWFISEASDTGLEHDGAPVVATWGTERPPYVVDGAATSTPVTRPLAPAVDACRPGEEAQWVRPVPA